MKKYIFAIIAFALMAWGCSSDNDDGTIPMGKDVRPEWQAPNYDILEQLMCVEVTLQDKLTPYASEADMMCATIDGEVRAVSTPYKVDDRWHFFMFQHRRNDIFPILFPYINDFSYFCTLYENRHYHRIARND